MHDDANTNRPWQADVERIARGIRRRVLGYTVENGGYLSQACSSAEIIALLYGHAMNLGPSQGPAIPLPFQGMPSATNKNDFTGAIYNGPKGPEYDRFVNSPTHYALTIYAALIETGRMAPEGMDQFNTDGNTVEMIGGEHSPGHEVNGGSFGQAVSQAAGFALAKRLRGEPGNIWVFMSDGEFQEGMVWEALMSMAFHKIDNLKILVDVNGQQVDGRMEDVMNVEPFVDKLSAFGAKAIKVDGHDIDALNDAATTPHPGQPLVVLAYTCPYQDMPIIEHRYPNLHHVRFKSEAERDVHREFLKTY